MEWEVGIWNFWFLKASSREAIWLLSHCFFSWVIVIHPDVIYLCDTYDTNGAYLQLIEVTDGQLMLFSLSHYLLSWNVINSRRQPLKQLLFRRSPFFIFAITFDHAFWFTYLSHGFHVWLLTYFIHCFRCVFNFLALNYAILWIRSKSKEQNQRRQYKARALSHWELGYQSSLECLVADIGIKLISFQFKAELSRVFESNWNCMPS